MPEAGVHRRFVELWRQLLDDELGEQGSHRLDLDQLAYVFVRIGESMLYADLISGREPDLELAATVQTMLLRDAALVG
jgi:hypothetical protein